MGSETVETAAVNDRPGTYAVVLRLVSAETIRIGRLGPTRFFPGRYLYIGSALGPGGLAARVRHHLLGSHRPHWHIDYLRNRAAGPRRRCFWQGDSTRRRPGQGAEILRIIAENCWMLRFAIDKCTGLA